MTKDIARYVVVSFNEELPALTENIFLDFSSSENKVFFSQNEDNKAKKSVNVSGASSVFVIIY